MLFRSRVRRLVRGPARARAGRHRQRDPRRGREHRPAPPVHRPRGDRLPELQRHDAPHARGGRRVVRQRRDAVRAVALPVRARGRVRAALPRGLHLRGRGPDARVVLHAACAGHAAEQHGGRGRRHRVPERHLPRSHPGRRGTEDVQVARERGRPVERAEPARRGRDPLVHVHRVAAGQRAPRGAAETGPRQGAGAAASSRRRFCAR